jgi:hypothetical protein
MPLASGLNFTNPMAQRANAPVVITLRRQSFFYAARFHQQKYAKIYHYAQLEITLNSNAVRFLPCQYKPTGAKAVGRTLMK